MKLGIMQPYFLPYMGYWQLMNLVDKYVIFDDVNYIVRGWVNRNRILLNGCPMYLTIPLSAASKNKLINEIQVDTISKLIPKALKTIDTAYHKAPYFSGIFPMAEKILLCDKRGLVDYIINSFILIREYLGIHSELILSSNIHKDNSLKGQDKIIQICEILGTDEYVNAIGGQDLYNRDEFAHKDIKLSFLRTDEIVYPQFGNDFQKNLSILDTMMFNSKSEVKEMLTKFTII